MKSLDIVTICFSEDVHLLKLQARSLARFMDAGILGQVILVINDPDPKAVQRRIISEALPDYGALADRIIFFDHSIGWLQERPGAGWYSQQILKLQVSIAVKSDAYLILDAKNHFIRAVKAADFFAPDGKLLSYQGPVAARFRPEHKNAYALFGMPYNAADDTCLPTTTPFLADRQTVRRMIPYIERRAGCDFASFFAGHLTDYTEFSLYSAYVEAVAGGIDTVYQRQAKPCATLHRSAAHDIARCQQVLARIKKRTIYSLGVHRHVIEEGDPDILALIWRAWRKLGLVAEGEERYFLRGRTLPEAPGGWLLNLFR